MQGSENIVIGSAPLEIPNKLIKEPKIITKDTLA